MRRRGRPPTRRAPEAVVPPPEEYVDESAYVPPPTVQSDPMPPQTGSPLPPEVMPTSPFTDYTRDSLYYSFFSRVLTSYLTLSLCTILKLRC